VQAPVDVTVVRAGVPDTVPGRVLDLGTGGVSAVLARELQPGESVGVEIQLPDAPDRLHARAQVRHNDRLRCGMEFVALSAEQKTAIQRIARKRRAEGSLSPVDGPSSADRGLGGAALSGSPPETSPTGAAKPARNLRVRGWMFLLASFVVLLGVLWWRWNRGWDDLESALHATDPIAEPETHVSADVMEKLVTHRVDPEYPEAARASNLQGVVIANLVIGRDGSVVNVRAVSGPQVFVQPATEALRWWRFEPYRQDGKPMIVETTVAVEFKP
jgi:TonB family protein